MSSREQIAKVWEELDDEGALVLAKIGGKILTRRFSTLDGIVGFADRLYGCDMFVHLNGSPSTLTRKSSTADVQTWKHIFIDVDGITTKQGRILQHLNIGRALNQLGMLSAATIINSGRGVHWWIRVDDPKFAIWDVSKPHVEMAMSKFLRHLARECQSEEYKIDTCTSDLARIARLPGTKNTRSGTDAAVLHKSTASISGRQFFELWKPTAEELSVQVPAVNPDGLTMRQLIPYISGSAANYITLGGGSPGRRAQAFACAKSLLEAGLSESQAWFWLSKGDEKSRPKPLGEQELRRVMENARRKHAAA